MRIVWLVVKNFGCLGNMWLCSVGYFLKKLVEAKVWENQENFKIENRARSTTTQVNENNRNELQTII